MPAPSYPVRSLRTFRYLDEGPSDGPPVLLLHGMLGDLSNWTHTVGALADAGYRAVVPVLPVYDLPLAETSVSGLTGYVRAFVKALGVRRPVLVGNSLGGHIALLYALAHPHDVPALVLSGASGIYEVSTGTSVPRRHDRAFIRERAAYTFYDPAHATDELIDEMYAVVTDRARVLRLIQMARATRNETVTERLHEVSAPTLLVWGRNDTITPPDVAETFREKLRNARLVLVDRCGHAPMIEHPALFNGALLAFLDEVRQPQPLAA